MKQKQKTRVVSGRRRGVSALARERKGNGSHSGEWRLRALWRERESDVNHLQVELNFILSFISTCYLSSTSFYLSSTPFCVPVFIQLCLAWNRERVALQLRAPPIDE